MKILFDKDQAIGLAGDAYVGPHPSLTAPENFDENNLHRYRLNENGELYLTPLQVVDFESDVQRRLDAFAQTKGYSSILSAASYASSKIEIYKTEGSYCVDVRDETWSKFYEIMQEIENGERSPIENFSEIESELPILAWPENVIEVSSNTESAIETSNTQIEVSSNTEVSNTESANT